MRLKLPFLKLTKFTPEDKQIKKLKKSMKIIYKEKTHQRIEMYKNLDQFSWAKNKDLKINDFLVLSLQDIYDSIPYILKKK